MRPPSSSNEAIRLPCRSSTVKENQLGKTPLPFPETIITERTVERSLGTFVVPAHVPAHVSELGLAVRVDALLGADQRDETFAIGVVGPDGVDFIGDPACLVVPDDPSLGRGWVDVGTAEIGAGEHELLARHAAAFPCYEPLGGWGRTNSVHFHGVRLAYYRVE